MGERISKNKADKDFLSVQRFGAGVLILNDPGQLEPIDYPPRTDEQELALPELVKRAREARLAFDESQTDLLK